MLLLKVQVPKSFNKLGKEIMKYILNDKSHLRKTDRNSTEKDKEEQGKVNAERQYKGHDHLRQHTVIHEKQI